MDDDDDGETPQRPCGSCTSELSSQPLRMPARLHQSGGRKQRHFPCLKRIAGVRGDRRLSAEAEPADRFKYFQ